jgi:hypothetical protein
MPMPSEADRLITNLHDLFALIGRGFAEPPRNPAEYYGEVARACADLVSAESCSIWLWDRRSDSLVLCGEHGYNSRGTKGWAPGELDGFVYGPGEGVTGRVFATGMPSSVKNASEVQKTPGHRGHLYEKLWEGKHPCHSWYQFPLAHDNAILEKGIGVMKVENKLDTDGNVVTSKGFSKNEKRILELLANSAVPIIYWSTELFEMVEQSRAAGPVAGQEYTSSIYDIFCKELLDSVYTIPKPRERELHVYVKAFIEHIRRNRGNPRCEYLEILREHLGNLIRVLGFESTLVDYLQPLSDYQPVLFQLRAYREHFVHQFNAFLIGYLILNRLPKPIFEHFRKVLDQQTPSVGRHKPLDVFRTWFLASMFHDTGYPLGKARDWIGTLVGRMFVTKIPPIDVTDALVARLMLHGAFDWLEFLRSRLCSIFSLNPQNARNLCDRIMEAAVGELDDDVVAALLLIKAAQRLELDESICAWASTAIAAHAEKIWSQLNRIYFQKHPYAFLLFFCDSAQEHGRRRIAEPGDPWVVTKTEVLFTDDTIRAILDYTQKPNNWAKVMKANEGPRRVFEGPNGLKFIIDYRVNGHPLETFEFESGPN